MKTCTGTFAPTVDGGRRRHVGEGQLKFASAAALCVLLGACADARSPTMAAPPRAVADHAGTDVNAGDQTASSDVDADGAGASVVIGTGDPNIDVPAVQAAVDQGGVVVLEGHLSFDRPPTKPLASSLSEGPPGLAYAPAAEIRVSRAVVISGSGKRGDGMTTIEAGTIPFYVDAPGQPVTIRRLRFVRPSSSAIIVYAVRDLEITSCVIAGVVTFKNLSDGIGINTSGPPPSLTAPGRPENVSGTLNIADNDIDMAGGTSADNTLGVVVFGSGTSKEPVDTRIVGNRIRNTTEPAINLRQLGGRAHVNHNAITTGTVVANATRDQAIRIAGTGAYRISNNSIDSEWPNPDAAGIAVFSNVASWPIQHAVVENNEIRMSAPAAGAFTAFSAGIEIFGYARDNIVRHNTIRGRARAALSIPVFPLPPQLPAVPQDNAFIDNRLIDFTPAVADIVIGPQSLRTRIAGPGTVKDDGDGTIILRPD